MTGQSETKHTPSDLRAIKAPAGHVRVSDGFDHDICTLYGPRREADAARIVLTWNCHEELVAALREALAALNGAPNTVGLHEQINAALAKATSPTP